MLFLGVVMIFCLGRSTFLFVGDYSVVFMGEVSWHLHHAEIVQQKASFSVLYMYIYIKYIKYIIYRT